MASVDVVDLSGIGPALAARLNELGVFTSEDLLRVERQRLADEVEGASVAQVRRWQVVAEFLEVDGLPLAIAEQLYERGVESLDELASRPLSGLHALVEAMRSDGDIAVAPSDDEIVGWMTDAIRLRNTGTLNGTVVGSTKAPIAGVSVSCMNQRDETDARGRFRVRRLPLGRSLLVYLDHPQHVARTVAVEEVAAPGVVRGEEFRLSRRRATTPAPRVLSELNGDLLPALSGAPIRLRVQDHAPAHDDILRVFETLDSGDVRAVSRFFDYDAGVFVLRSYRLEQTDLAGSPGLRDHLQFADGRWKPVELTAKDIDAYRRKLRERRRHPKLPDNPTAADVDRAIRDWQQARRTTARP